MCRTFRLYWYFAVRVASPQMKRSMQSIINLQKGSAIVSISYKFHRASAIINLNPRDNRVARNGGSWREIIIYIWPKSVLWFIKHYPTLSFYEVTWVCFIQSQSYFLKCEIIVWLPANKSNVSFFWRSKCIYWSILIPQRPFVYLVYKP